MAGAVPLMEALEMRKCEIIFGKSRGNRDSLDERSAATLIRLHFYLKKMECPLGREFIFIELS